MFLSNGGEYSNLNVCAARGDPDDEYEFVDRHPDFVKHHVSSYVYYLEFDVRRNAHVRMLVPSAKPKAKQTARRAKAAAKRSAGRMLPTPLHSDSEARDENGAAFDVDFEALE